jgi:hypothetical protein
MLKFPPSQWAGTSIHTVPHTFAYKGNIMSIRTLDLHIVINHDTPGMCFNRKKPDCSLSLLKHLM